MDSYVSVGGLVKGSLGQVFLGRFFLAAESKVIVQLPDEPQHFTKVLQILRFAKKKGPELDKLARDYRNVPLPIQAELDAQHLRLRSHYGVGSLKVLPKGQLGAVSFPC